MIGAMPRSRPPHLQREVTRHGKVVWYHRIDDGPRTRIHGEFGGDAFMAEYRAAEAGIPVAPPAKAGKGTLAWLLEQYRDSGAWLALSAATRKQRENIFKHVIETAGLERATAIASKTIKAGLERRKHTPSQARNFLDAMRGLYEWAVIAEHVAIDPTAGVKAPPRPKTRGFKKWADDEVTAYYAKWPLGTRQRVWLDVLLYTGLRRGDAVLIGRQMVRHGILTLRTEKSQEEITITIPILPVLQATLDAGPTGDLTFICGAKGGALTKESFGNEFSAAAREAGIRKSAHGLRKLGATRAAENGATEAQLDSLFGWKRGSGTSAIYTRDAERARLGKAAAGMLVRTPDEQSIPAPTKSRPRTQKISKQSQ